MPEHVIMEVSEAELQGLYTWVDEIPLSRPKRNIARDFSDGVLLAEVVHYYFPKLVELHNYSSANSTQQKNYNWSTLNNKVLKRLGFSIPKPDVDAIVNCQPGAIERALKLVKVKIAKFREEGGVPAPVTSGPIKVAPQTYGDSGGYDQGMQQIHAGAHTAMAPVAAPPPRAGSGGGAQPARGAATRTVAAEALAERDQVINELKETNEILETKVRKLEQLVRLKDAKISTLMAKLQAAGLA